MFTVLIDGATLYHPRGGDDNALLDAVLSLEDNKSGSFELTVPITNSQYENIAPFLNRIVLFEDGVVVWAGRPISVEIDWNLNKRVTCEGWIAVLRDAPVTKYALDAHNATDATGYALRDVYKTLFERFNQFMGSETNKLVDLGTCDFPYIKNADGSDIVTSYLNIGLSDGDDRWKSTYFDLLFDGIEAEEESSALPNITEPPYNGHIVPRYTATGTTVVDILADTPTVSDQKIEFGKNLLDLTQFINPDKNFSVLYPRFNGRWYLDGTTSPINAGSFTNGKLLENQTAINVIGRVVRALDIRSTNGRSDEVDTQEKREALAAPYLAAGLQSALTVNVSALDLSLLGVNVESIELHKKYEIVSAPHNFDEIYQCTGVRLNLLEPQSNEYQFGPTRETLTGWIEKSIKQASGTAASASSTATAASVTATRTEATAEAAATSAAETAEKTAAAMETVSKLSASLRSTKAETTEIKETEADK